MLDAAHRPLTVWFFRRGLPVKYTGPAFNATQNTVAIEAIEIAARGHSSGAWLQPELRRRRACRKGGVAMQVEIGEVSSTVRSVDGEALLSPRGAAADRRGRDAPRCMTATIGTSARMPSERLPAASAPSATRRSSRIAWNNFKRRPSSRPTATGPWTSWTSSSIRPSSRSTRARRSPKSRSPDWTRRSCSSSAGRPRS